MLLHVGGYDEDPKQGVSNRYENERDGDLVSPLLLGVFGVRNSGKSFLVSKYLIASQKRKRPLYDRVFLISPSFVSNKSYWEPYISEEDTREPTDTALVEVIGEIEQEARDWDEFTRRLNEHKRVVSKMRNGSEPSDEELIVAMRNGWLEPAAWLNGNKPEPPEWKHHRPGFEDRTAQSLLIMDDCLAQPQMLASPTLVRLAALNRHLAGLEEPFVSKSGNVRTSCALSVIFLSQTYKMSVGGPGRVLRENLTHAAVFENKHPAQLKAIAEELGTAVDVKRFMRAYALATKDKYGSVLVDFKPTRPELQFRKGLSEAIVVD